MPLPKDKGGKTIEYADPCASLLYRALGKKFPAKEGTADK